MLQLNFGEKGNYFVYLFVMEGSIYHKIGYTNDVVKRLACVNTSTPQSVEYVQKYEFSERIHARYFERRLHRMFKDSRLKNKYTDQFKEWFLLTADQVNSISREYQKFLIHISKDKTPINRKLFHAM